MSHHSPGGWGPPPGFSPPPPGGGYGPPAGGFGGPPGPGYGWGPPGGYGAAPPPAAASGRAVASLICSVLSWVMCGCITSVPGALLAWSELKAIEVGEAPAAGKTLAQIAFWVGIVNVGLYFILIALYAVLFAAGAAGAFP